MQNIKQDAILSIKNVSKYFPGVKALDQVSIEVERGTVHGIVGENGAGKSTLMKILSGVHSKDSGTIIFDGELVENTTPILSMKSGLSIIYQELNLVSTMTVGENIFLGRFGELGGIKHVHERAKALLKRIGSHVTTYKLVSELSVSEKQMVEIAKALSFDSKLIIMDEPSSSLTADEMKALVKIIHQLRLQGISIIYISHKLDEIFEFCSVVTIMRDGHVIDSKKINEITRSEMITKMVGRTIENEYPKRPNCVGETLMEVQSINTKKLRDIAFKLNKGEILGLVGLVGAGRTEIVRAIFGADKIKGHKITIDGNPVKIRKPSDAKKAGIALVTEDRKTQGLVLPFSVENNISMATLDKISKYGFLNKSMEAEIAERHVNSLGIKTPSIKTTVKNLSGGNQQKCILGRWLEINPRILILDEPTRGIDVGAKYEIYLLMKQIVESGSAIILISSELPEVLNMSNRVLTVCEGRITGEFDPNDSTPDQIMSKAFASERKE
ncbi:sugar ABC transporter ATP-binding protein [Fusibacter sp. 3D3]|uniref:sugar ABC transporter ATP-binding protein n=1 Tax=Fusibacter sp. 3D3 TaxID=1048380 RepID=UPI000853A44D|nr:sugar ABC transporter ATP-binding protein [Fusibacter sp. 3D3]GAU78819.1 ribose ABC transport system, ATP-binding protein RbsA [Fusibacter sp. 3D3]